jgi:hypothetical protein
MSVSFEDSKYSIAMAKHHVADLERQITEFFKTQPYGHVVETDAKTGEHVHKYKLIKPMPVRLKGIARDAVINLRSALDQAMFAFTGRHTYFPFAKDAVHFENAVKGRCKGIPKEITALLRTFKPYVGGDDLLWALNALSNTNKHGIIAPVAVSNGAVTYNDATFFNGGPNIMAPVWNRAKNEMELFRVRPTTYGYVNLSVTTHVVICGVEVVNGKPVVGTLNELISKVEGIVMAVEAEARRLGLV